VVQVAEYSLSMQDWTHWVQSLVYKKIKQAIQQTCIGDCTKLGSKNGGFDGAIWRYAVGGLDNHGRSCTCSLYSTLKHTVKATSTAASPGLWQYLAYDKEQVSRGLWHTQVRPKQWCNQRHPSLTQSHRNNMTSPSPKCSLQTSPFAF
jgi:hypothetical protein